VTIVANVPLNDRLAAVDRRARTRSASGAITSAAGRAGTTSASPPRWRQRLR
jgi:hypothetical protein